MKKQNKTLFLIIISIAIIVLPIAYHQITKVINGINMAKRMSAPTRVETRTIEKRSIHDTADYVGRIEARREVKLVARVSGWLQKQYYNDGDYVKKGQLLFLIEPDAYIIAVKNAEATLRRVQASYDNSLVELNRAKELVKGDYVSKSYYDQAYAKYAADKASVDAAKADLDKKRLDLSYTKVYSPYDGKIGDSYLSPGNYVTAQTGELATLVTMNPIYASFTVKKDDLKRFYNENSDTFMPDAEVTIKLADGSEYDEPGKLDFMDNVINKDLGTIMLRATFENSKSKLIPNDFVRVVLKSNSEKDVLLVPQSAVLENVSSKYVWIIDENNSAKQQNIDVYGAYKEYWIIKNGLKEGDVVISSNLQSLRQGSKVQVIELSEEVKAQKLKAREEAVNTTVTQKPNEKNQKKEVEAE